MTAVFNIDVSLIFKKMNIKYFIFNGLTLTEIHLKLLKMYKDTSPSLKKNYGLLFLNLVVPISKMNHAKYFQKDKTIDSKYYCNLLEQLDTKFVKQKSVLKGKNNKIKINFS